MIRCILFDLDGTLVDAGDWHFEALNRALGQYAISYEEHLEKYDGKTTRTKLAMLSEHKGLPRHLHDHVSREKQKRTLEVIRTRCQRDERLVALFKELERRGYLLGACSNAVRNTVHIMLERLGLSGHVDLILSNEDISRPKPEPDMYLKAMAHFGVEPHETLVLEDNHVGIASARASGAHVLEVAGPQDVTLEAIENFTAGGKNDSQHSDAACGQRAAV